MKVAPSILSADFSQLGEEVKRLEAAGADYIHIDMMDGTFVPNLSFGPMVMQAIRSLTDLPFDVHMMIEQPERYIDEVAKAGADIITVHPEATAHIHRAIQQIKAHNIKAGIVINPGTPVEAVLPVIELVDMVLIMSVNPGFGGQAFIPEVLEKVTQIKKWREERQLTFEIEIDGGVDNDTIKAIAAAGVDVVVSGSYLFNADDLTLAIESLK